MGGGVLVARADHGLPPWFTRRTGTFGTPAPRTRALGRFGTVPGCPCEGSDREHAGAGNALERSERGLSAVLLRSGFNALCIVADVLALFGSIAWLSALPLLKSDLSVAPQLRSPLG